MKNRIIILMAVAVLMFSACKRRPEQDKNIIDKPDIEIKDGKLSPEALWSFGRIGETRELRIKNYELWMVEPVETMYTLF